MIYLKTACMWHQTHRTQRSLKDPLFISTCSFRTRSSHSQRLKADAKQAEAICFIWEDLDNMDGFPSKIQQELLSPMKSYIFISSNTLLKSLAKILTVL